ncbi:hypothetical protein [Sandaracinus amylolyticus]|uniref:hypothetical protein n=1 Tax=Sandaracinus amylolyticus TaxID=927083 RepID=UPI001F19DC41|nr:hypothetical protein [Sandaracinus amylolyticus]UJR83850.1 Hypothetical protein I5071_59210 [Sandaracinus amylolyticus]
MRFVWIVALALTLGCVASETYRGRAFVPAPRHYRVRYVEGEHDARRILPEGWRVRDHRVDGEGRPTRPFDAREDRIRIALDVDGDREVDLRGTAPRYDLLYEHDEDGSEIAAITLPVDARIGRRSLATLAHALLDGVFGEGFVDWSGDRARAYELRIVDESQAQVGGVDAHVVTFELAQSLPGRGVAWGRGTTTTMVLVRPPLRWKPDARASEDGAPMLVVLFYESRSESYALHRADFDAMLDRLDVRPE